MLAQRSCALMVPWNIALLVQWSIALLIERSSVLVVQRSLTLVVHKAASDDELQKLGKPPIYSGKENEWHEWSFSSRI